MVPPPPPHPLSPFPHPPVPGATYSQDQDCCKPRFQNQTPAEEQVIKKHGTDEVLTKFDLKHGLMLDQAGRFRNRKLSNMRMHIVWIGDCRPREGLLSRESYLAETILPLKVLESVTLNPKP